MAIDLGDGLTAFAINGQTVGIDLVGWVKWYTDVAAEYAEKPYKLLDAVAKRLHEECGVQVNYTQADAFLHAVMLQYGEIKKKQADERTSASSTDSTRSDSRSLS
jgi:hypothetical protein